MRNPQQMRVGKEALDLLFEVTVLLHRDASVGLAEEGLTPSRAAVLWYVRRRGPSVHRDLAAAMKVNPRSVTGLVDALAADGFVTRKPHPSDRRAALVTLTGRGTRVVERLERQQEEFVSLLFGDTPSKRLEELVGGLRAVVERLYELGLSQEGADG